MSSDAHRNAIIVPLWRMNCVVIGLPAHYSHFSRWIALNIYKIEKHSAMLIFMLASRCVVKFFLCRKKKREHLRPNESEWLYYYFCNQNTSGYSCQMCKGRVEMTVPSKRSFFIHVPVLIPNEFLRRTKKKGSTLRHL